MLALILCSILSANCSFVYIIDDVVLAQNHIKDDTRTITGKVVSVHDGDTLTVLEGTTQIKVRLAEIDAPELKQAFGQRARQALGEKVFGQEVCVEWKSKDRYGRVLGTVYLGTESVNLWLVRNGWAWRYEKYSKSDILKQAQDEARKERKGLWADERPIEPWEWRKQKSPTPAPRTPLQTN